MTSAQDRQLATRERKEKAGLRRIEVWVPADRVDEIRAMVSAICDGKRSDQN